jgi:hypothetical protein
MIIPEGCDPDPDPDGGGLLSSFAAPKTIGAAIYPDVKMVAR